jgi:hypothetical protein
MVSLNAFVVVFFAFFGHSLSLKKDLHFREINRVVGNETWKYVIDDGKQNFSSAIQWCHEMGGQLPAIHCQADLDFLADDVVVKASPGRRETWIGLRKENGSCETYLDGSHVDYSFHIYNGRVCSAERCKDGHCALKMWNTVNNHKKVYFFPTSTTARSVCVIKHKTEKRGCKSKKCGKKDEITNENQEHNENDEAKNSGCKSKKCGKKDGITNENQEHNENDEAKNSGCKSKKCGKKDEITNENQEHNENDEAKNSGCKSKKCGKKNQSQDDNEQQHHTNDNGKDSPWKPELWQHDYTFVPERDVAWGPA